MDTRTDTRFEYSNIRILAQTLEQTLAQTLECTNNVDWHLIASNCCSLSPLKTERLKLRILSTEIDEKIAN